MQINTAIFQDSVSFSERFQTVLSYQIENNPVYRSFYSAFQNGNTQSATTDQLPLLPIRAFKDTKVLCDSCSELMVFKSSATGQQGRSRHFIPFPELYRESIFLEFYRHFPKEEYAILAYTPGYSENPDSSLIWMLNELIKNDPSGLSRFLPIGKSLRSDNLEDILNSEKNILLFGAAFGLLDLVDLKSVNLPPASQVIETGGMKTHRREMSKPELRKALSEGFGLPLTHIHSEYGMCEMQSQCYAIGSEWFSTPPWVKVMIKNPESPLENCAIGEEGKIGVIDLANMHTCPFILTEDRGVMGEDGSFRVLGRWRSDNLRGCNFLIDRD